MANATQFSIDLDPPFSFFAHNPIVLNSFPDLQHTTTDCTTAPMDATRSPPPLTTIQFPVNLNSSSSSHQQPQHDHVHDHDHKRTEMDFFAERNHNNNNNKQVVGDDEDDDDDDDHVNHNIHTSDTDIKETTDRTVLDHVNVSNSNPPSFVFVSFN